MPKYKLILIHKENGIVMLRKLQLIDIAICANSKNTVGISDESILKK